MSDKSPKARKPVRPKVVRKSDVGDPMSDSYANENKSEIENKRQNPLDHLEITNNSEKSEIEHPIRLKADEIKTMEVHHHPEVEKKGFKEYILEGLMIFLAVTMGFFAESLREHINERNNANDLAHSFYLELKRDSAAIQTVQMHRMKRDSSLTYLRKYFRDSAITNCSKTFSVNFMYGFEIFSPYVFEPKDGILNQLKNSGSLRYFKNMELQKLTGDLSEAIANIRTRNEFESNFMDAHLIPYLIKHNDMDFFGKVNSLQNLYLFNTLSQYEKSKTIFPFHFNKPQEFDKTESVNMVGSYQMICWGASIKQYTDYQKLNTELLKELRKEYDLE
jgi:hypothetical protein